MMKRLVSFLLFFAAASFSFSQDMPPLPPLANQSAPATATDNSSANAGAPALPPLPDQSSGQQQAPAASTASPQASSDQGAPALPPLPNQPAASPSGGQTAAPEMPPLPGQQTAAPATQAEQPPAPAATAPAPAAPTEQGQAAATTETAQAPQGGEAKPAKKAGSQAWWTKTKHRVNVIFAGWVSPKGGNESSRIAWTSQEVLNALVFKGYKVVKEDGKYDGQEGAGGHQWREITFSVPKSKLTTQVYMKQVGKRVWLRVGPSEPPAFANHGVEQVQKIREVNLKALHLVQKKLGRRLAPHRIVRSWEAPYRFDKETVVE